MQPTTELRLRMELMARKAKIHATLESLEKIKESASPIISDPDQSAKLAAMREEVRRSRLNLKGASSATRPSSPSRSTPQVPKDANSFRESPQPMEVDIDQHNEKSRPIIPHSVEGSSGANSQDSNTLPDMDLSVSVVPIQPVTSHRAFDSIVLEPRFLPASIPLPKSPTLTPIVNKNGKRLRATDLFSDDMPTISPAPRDNASLSKVISPRPYSGIKPGLKPTMSLSEVVASSVVANEWVEHIIQVSDDDQSEGSDTDVSDDPHEMDEEDVQRAKLEDDVMTLISNAVSAIPNNVIRTTALTPLSETPELAARHKQPPGMDVIQVLEKRKADLALLKAMIANREAKRKQGSQPTADTESPSQEDRKPPQEDTDPLEHTNTTSVTVMEEEDLLTEKVTRVDNEGDVPMIPKMDLEIDLEDHGK